MKVDIIWLSDAFRRHACLNHPEDSAVLVAAGRSIAAQCTHYRPEFSANSPVNHDIDRNVRHLLAGIAECGARMGATEIVLPLSGDPRSWIGRRVCSLLDGMQLPVTVSLQAEEYNQDMALLGQIDRAIPTVLDKGVRGLADIHEKLIYRWDR